MNDALADAARQACRRYGTPLYLYDLPRMRADAASFADAFAPPWLRLYSLKANGLPPLVREMAGTGFGASAVSGGELALAMRAGVAPGATALEGIGKSDGDLRRVAELLRRGQPLLWVSLESADEARQLARLVSRTGHRQDVLVRINPQVSPETRRGLAVGAVGSKFGVLAEELPALVEAGGGPAGPLRWRGLHVHVGSQLGAVDAWRAAFRLGLRLLELQRATLTEFDTLDAGGGFPAAEEGVAVPEPARFAHEAAAELELLPAGARPARLAIEPGRSVVAGCGWLLGRVLHVRRRERPVVVIDAGMTELIRPALYGAHHPLRPLTVSGRAADSSTAPLNVRVDGPICEATDTLGEASLPELARGDLLAIGMTGAYGSAMGSTYNGRPRPPEIAWDGERLIVWRRRGSVRSLP